MTVPKDEDIIVVMPEIEQMLGKTADQIRGMSLKELARVAFERGYVWKVLPTGGLVEGLTIRSEKEK